MKPCVSKVVDLAMLMFFPQEKSVDHFLRNPWISHDVSFPPAVPITRTSADPTCPIVSSRCSANEVTVIFGEATSTWGWRRGCRSLSRLGSQLHSFLLLPCGETQVWPVELDLETHFFVVQQRHLATTHVTHRNTLVIVDHHRQPIKTPRGSKRRT